MELLTRPLSLVKNVSVVPCIWNIFSKPDVLGGRVWERWLDLGVAAGLLLGDGARLEAAQWGVLHLGVLCLPPRLFISLYFLATMTWAHFLHQVLSSPALNPADHGPKMWAKISLSPLRLGCWSLCPCDKEVPQTVSKNKCVQSSFGIGKSSDFVVRKFWIQHDRLINSTSACSGLSSPLKSE